MFNGKIHYKWPCSIAMLVHQRVVCFKPADLLWAFFSFFPTFIDYIWFVHLYHLFLHTTFIYIYDNIILPRMCNVGSIYGLAIDPIGCCGKMEEIWLYVDKLSQKLVKEHL